MPNLLTRVGLTVALIAVSAAAARPVLAAEAAFVAARSFQTASAHQFGLAAMVVALVAFVGIAAAHWKALASAIGYRPSSNRRRRFGRRLSFPAKRCTKPMHLEIDNSFSR